MIFAVALLAYTAWTLLRIFALMVDMWLSFGWYRDAQRYYFKRPYEQSFWAMLFWIRSKR